MPQLIFHRDGREVLRFPLHVDEVRLGRHGDNDVSLPDPQVSRFHVVLFRHGRGYILENLSRMGTFIRKQAVDKITLKDQDIFQLGPWQVLYEESVTPEEAETTQGLGKTDPSSVGVFCGMIGQSTMMQRIFELVRKGADSLLPVMIQGETGTGKELVAHAFHTLSKRRGSFVALNCGAISASLIESELFGHERAQYRPTKHEEKPSATPA